MKKGLFLLPLIGGFVLAGCDFSLESLMFWKKSDTEQKDSGGSSGGGGTQPPAATRKDPKAPDSDLTIDINVLGEYFSEGYTYPKDDYEFTLGGFDFEATAGVGQKTSEQEGGNYYYEQKVLQFRSSSNANGVGRISNYDPIIASKITINWFATFDSEAKKYQPVVKAATEPDKVEDEAGMTANEGATVKGTATGEVQSTYISSTKTNEDKAVYAYTTTYNISGKNYFSISAPGGAMYVKSIVINK